MSRQAATARIPSNAGHRTGVRRTPAPRAPRRVSGPASHRHAATAAATAVAPRTAAARRGAVAAPLPRLLPDLGRVRALPDHGVLDALLRSRAWIWVIGVLLGGVVAMQVSLLKLNSGIGRAVQTSSTLERQNAELEAQIARQSAGIRTAATAAGMVLPDAGVVRYLDTRDGDARRAARRMEPPSATALALVAAGGIGSAAPGTTGATTTSTTTAPPVASTKTTTTTTAPLAQQQQQQQGSVPPQPTPTPPPAATPAPTPPAATATGTTGATAAPSGQG
jgi:hypothetical protein